MLIHLRNLEVFMYLFYLPVFKINEDQDPTVSYTLIVTQKYRDIHHTETYSSIYV